MIARSSATTFVVGITGHRPNKLSPTAAMRVEGQLRELFAAIDAACAGRLALLRLGEDTAVPAIRLVSSFAEGADQLAVAACPANWKITALLPMPREGYEQDFILTREGGEIISDRRPGLRVALERADRIVELEEGDGRPAAYARANAAMLRQIDMLVAVWDTAPAAGPGGTAEAVEGALAVRVPVIWIASVNERKPSLLLGASPLKARPSVSVAETVRAAIDAALARGRPAMPG